MYGFSFEWFWPRFFVSVRVWGLRWRQHPVQGFEAADRSRALAISLHGDEGAGKTRKSVLILSWAPLAVHDPSMISKYPFAVLKSDCYAYNKENLNLTLDSLQSALAKSFNLCNMPNPECGGYTPHIVCGKGDWKHKREFLRTPRHYGLSDQICGRCLCSGLPNTDKPWYDAVLERFNNIPDLAAAVDTSVGHAIYRTWIMLAISFFGFGCFLFPSMPSDGNCPINK